MTQDPSRLENNPGWSHYVLLVGCTEETQTIAWRLQENQLFIVTAEDADKAATILRGLKFDCVLMESGDAAAWQTIVGLVQSQAPLQGTCLAVVGDELRAADHPEGVEMLPRDPSTIADHIRNSH